MKSSTLIAVLLIAVLLSGCISPFAPIVLAPANVTVVSSPEELPEQVRIELQGKKVSWNNVVSIDTGRNIEFPPEFFAHLSEYAFSGDGLYMVYHRVGGIGYDRIEMINLETKATEILLDQTEFPGSAFFGDVSISPDNQNVIVAVYFKTAGDLGTGDLVKIDLVTHTWKLLNVDVVLGGFGDTDISPDGKILVKCGKRSGARPVVELCLLDENGKFIRYLTNEGYPWPGSGLFTPDGEWVVYESRYKLYKVRIDGSDKQEVAPCGGGVFLVTENYALTSCAISEKPTCFGYFAASLDGKNLWQLGYLEPHCLE